MQRLIVSLYLIVLVCGSTTDWTHNCPTGCTCMWINGRKTAECREGGFKTIPPGLSDELQVLDLRGNAITSLRGHAFRDAGLINLNKIKMTHCGLERVDRLAFAGLTILVELDLSDNRIKELSMESFESNARLRELQLSSNPLVQLLGSGFPPLLYFQKLSLRSCNLSNIPPRAFEQLTTIEQLDLSGNRFETLSEDLFRHLPKLKALGLYDNPWKCDCRLQSFRDWALTNNLLTGMPTKCAHPDRLANFEWGQLLTTHFTCSPEIVTLTISGQAMDAYIVGDVGKTLRLECLVRGNPPADVRWVKDTVAMTNDTATASGKSYYVQVSGDTERWVNLTLTSTHLGDAGEYTCVGENKGGSAERNITLNFEDVPSGAGVGMGMGSEGPLPGRSWLWILIGCLAGLLLIGLLIGLLFCLCSKRPRKDRRSETKTDGSKVNGSGPPVLAKAEAAHCHGHGESTILAGESCPHPRHHISESPRVRDPRPFPNGPDLSTFHCTATSPCFLAGVRRLQGYDGLGPELELCDVARSTYPAQDPNHFVPRSPAGTYDLINSLLTSPGHGHGHGDGHGGSPRLVNSETQTTTTEGMQLEELKSGEDTLDKGSKVNDLNQSVMPLLSDSEVKGDDPDYPDLLDLPHGSTRADSPIESLRSRSTAPDTTRLVHLKQPIYYHPQELDAGALYEPPRNATLLHSHPYLTPYGRAHSPFSGSVASFAGTETQRAIVPPPHRRAYVTLPRKPRAPSWGPTTPLSISPSGSSILVGVPHPLTKYDNLGRRTTADGSSQQNLNKIGTTPSTTPQSVSHYPSSSASTPGYHYPAGTPQSFPSTPRDYALYASSTPRGDPIYGSSSTPRGDPIYGSSTPRGDPIYGSSTPRGDPIYGSTTPQNYPSTLPKGHRINGYRTNGYDPPVQNYFNFDPIQEHEGAGESPNEYEIIRPKPSAFGEPNATPTAKKVPPKPPPKPTKKLDSDSPLPPDAESAIAPAESQGDDGTEV